MDLERELEVKVLNMDLDKLEDRVIHKGGKLIGHEKQKNILIDSSARPLKSFLDGYLRIRITKDLLEDKIVKTLTLKKNIIRNDIRENIEYNINIDDEKTLLSLLEELGYNDIDIGYKDRRSYDLEGIRIDLDIWDEKTYPYPYAEIEVKNSEDLDKALRQLDIPRENVSLKSIKELQDELK